jgi:tetratricopeptide (TPR) repeat protein
MTDRPDMSQPPEPPFTEVATLIERSEPVARRSWLMPALGLFVMLVLVSAWLSGRSKGWSAVIDVASGVIMIGLGIGMALLMSATVRRQREERLRLEAIEELVQLRRWPEAATMLEGLLSRPTRTPWARVQGLIYLAMTLARFNRFDDAIKIQNHLLETVNLDPGTAHALRLGRAMAMLREDHLFDADRAITELRRDVSRAAAADSDRENQPDAPPASAGLALIEIYRDVKTGHPGEAIEMFDRSLPTLRRQLGHRVADAYALAARAHDFLGRTDQAQSHWEKATLLSPAIELARRYPEVSVMMSKYQPATAPAEAA